MIYKRLITCDSIITNEKAAGASIEIIIDTKSIDATFKVHEFEKRPKKNRTDHIFPASEFENALKKYDEIREGWKQ